MWPHCDWITFLGRALSFKYKLAWRCGAVSKCSNQRQWKLEAASWVTRYPASSLTAPCLYSCLAHRCLALFLYFCCLVPVLPHITLRPSDFWYICNATSLLYSCLTPSVLLNSAQMLMHWTEVCPSCNFLNENKNAFVKCLGLPSCPLVQISNVCLICELGEAFVDSWKNRKWDKSDGTKHDDYGGW